MNMKKTYVSITITHYSDHIVKPSVMYYQSDGVNPGVLTLDELTVAEANRLMWELVKLGGTNTYKANMLNNAISERNVTFHGEL
jgi:hypothetical protein